MSERAATIAQVIRTALDRHSERLRVSMPGQIVSFNPVEQTADVRPLLPDVNAGITEPLPTIPAVPVVFSGGGGFAETWPVTAGDECLIVFSDRSLDRWFVTGAVLDPRDLRTHDLSDAIAILGARPRPQALPQFDPVRAVWGNNGPRIAADGLAVHLGVDHLGVGLQFALRGTQFVSDLSIFVGAVAGGATAASAAATAAAGSLATAATNLIPNPPAAVVALTAASGSLGGVAAGLASISTAVATFLAGAPAWLTDKVRTP